MNARHYEMYMNMASEAARASTAAKLKVGCIAVRDHQIISVGYNGSPSGWSNVCEDDSGKTFSHVLHAEENCILKMARSTVSGEGATLFCTHSPCIACARLIYGAGIRKVIYKESYRCDSGIDFLKRCRIEVLSYDFIIQATS